MRTIGFLISDTHGGFKYGLMNPNVVLYDRDENGSLEPHTPAMTAVQEYFWELLLDGCEKVKEWAKGDPIVVIHTGDATHGNKYLNALVSTELSDQPIIAVSNFEPILGLPNVRSCRLVTGTNAHNFDEGSAENLIVSSLKYIYRNIDINKVEVGLADVGGVKIEYAHQGAFPGTKHHLMGNVAHQFLRDRMTIELLNGKKPPRLYLYGHWHEWLYVTENISIKNKDYTSSLIIMPSFNFPNGFTTAATKAQARFTHGIVAIEIIDGKLTDVKRFTHTVDRRTREVL